MVAKELEGYDRVMDDLNEEIGRCECRPEYLDRADFLKGIQRTLEGYSFKDNGWAESVNKKANVCIMKQTDTGQLKVVSADSARHFGNWTCFVFKTIA